MLFIFYSELHTKILFIFSLRERRERVGKMKRGAQRRRERRGGWEGLGVWVGRRGNEKDERCKSKSNDVFVNIKYTKFSSCNSHEYFIQKTNLSSEKNSEKNLTSSTSILAIFIISFLSSNHSIKVDCSE